MRFSVKYLPTTLFSLKDSNSTNSGAKALFLPSPYSIKMAILNQAITIGGELSDLNKKGNLNFQIIRNVKISYHIPQGISFCVSNSFVKILKPAREGGGFQQTVAFREYMFISDAIEIIFEVTDELGAKYLQKYLHKINYFGKKGCFFQFLCYSETPTEPNVTHFKVNAMQIGIMQEYDDFDEKATFDNVNSLANTTSKRRKQIMVLPLKKVSTSKSYSNYQTM